MQAGKHEWQMRPQGVAQRWTMRGWVAVVTDAWEQCARCGVSRGAAERFGWQGCATRTTTGGEHG